MIFVNKVLMPFHPYVMVGFQNLAIQKTALSAAYSANFHRAITGVYPNLEVDYSKMMTSKGHFPGLTDPEMKLITPEKLEINWQNISHSAAAYDDQLMLTVYSPELHLTDGFIGGIKRAAKTTVFTLDPLLIGKSLEVYISVMSANRKKIADSVYLGRITS